jgi:hypothetical protein
MRVLDFTSQNHLAVVAAAAAFKKTWRQQPRDKVSFASFLILQLLCLAPPFRVNFLTIEAYI